MVTVTDPQDEETFFPHVFSETIQPFQQVLLEWKRDNSVNYSELSRVMLKNFIPRLSLGLDHFITPMPTEINELDCTDVYFYGARIPTTKLERELVNETRRQFKMTETVTHLMFKQFVSSKSCPEKLRYYVVNSAYRKSFYDNELLPLFTQFCFSERISFLTLLHAILDSRSNSSHPCHSLSLSLCADLLCDDHDRFAEKLIDQLIASEMVELATRNNIYRFQLLREYVGLLELIQVLIVPPFSKPGVKPLSSEYIFKFFNWAYNVSLQSLHINDGKSDTSLVNICRAEALITSIQIHFLDLQQGTISSISDSDSQQLHRNSFLNDVQLVSKLKDLSSDRNLRSGNHINLTILGLFFAYLKQNQSLIPQELSNLNISSPQPNVTIDRYLLGRSLDSDSDKQFFWLTLHRMLSHLPVNSPHLSHATDQCRPLLRFFFMSLIDLVPELVLPSLDIFYECIGLLYDGNTNNLSTLFWEVDIKCSKRTTFLTLAKSLYPIRSFSLPSLLAKLVPPSNLAANKFVLSYFKSLTTFSTPYSETIYSSVKPVDDCENSDKVFFRALKPIETSCLPVATIFQIPTHTKGFLSFRHVSRAPDVFWAINYSGWDYLMYQLHIFLAQVDTNAVDSQLTSGLEAGLGLLYKLLSSLDDPSRIIHHLFSKPKNNEMEDTAECHPSIVCAVNSTASLTQKLTTLCNRFMLDKKNPIGHFLFNYSIGILGYLLPVHHTTIYNFLYQPTLLFHINSSSSKDANIFSLNDLVVANSVSLKDLQILQAILQFGFSVAQFYFNRSMMFGEKMLPHMTVPKFINEMVKFITNRIFPTLLWQGGVCPTKRMQLSGLCFEILSLIPISNGDDDHPTPGSNTLKEGFLLHERAPALVTVLQFIHSGPSIFKQFVHHKELENVDVMTSQLSGALHFLQRLLHFKLKSQSKEGDYWVTLLLTTHNEFDLVSDLIEWVNLAKNKRLSCAAAQTLSLLIVLASQSKQTDITALQKLQFNISKLAKYLHWLVSDKKIQGQIRQNAWVLLSTMAQYQPTIMSQLLSGLSQDGIPTHAPFIAVIKDMVMEMHNCIKTEPNVTIGFTLLLLKIWQSSILSHIFCEQIIGPIELWLVVHTVLFGDFTDQLPSGHDFVDTLIKTNLLKLIRAELTRLNRSITGSASSPTVCPHFLKLLSSLTKAHRLERHYSSFLRRNPEPSALFGLGKLAMQHQFSTSALWNFHVEEWDAELDIKQHSSVNYVFNIVQLSTIFHGGSVIRSLALANNEYFVTNNMMGFCTELFALFADVCTSNKLLTPPQYQVIKINLLSEFIKTYHAYALEFSNIGVYVYGWLDINDLLVKLLASINVFHFSNDEDQFDLVTMLLELGGIITNDKILVKATPVDFEAVMAYTLCFNKYSILSNIFRLLNLSSDFIKSRPLVDRSSVLEKGHTLFLHVTRAMRQDDIFSSLPSLTPPSLTKFSMVSDMLIQMLSLPPPSRWVDQLVEYQLPDILVRELITSSAPSHLLSTLLFNHKVLYLIHQLLTKYPSKFSGFKNNILNKILAMNENVLLCEAEEVGTEVVRRWVVKISLMVLTKLYLLDDKLDEDIQMTLLSFKPHYHNFLTFPSCSIEPSELELHSALIQLVTTMGSEGLTRLTAYPLPQLSSIAVSVESYLANLVQCLLARSQASPWVNSKSPWDYEMKLRFDVHQFTIRRDLTKEADYNNDTFLIFQMVANMLQYINKSWKSKELGSFAGAFSTNAPTLSIAKIGLSNGVRILTFHSVLDLMKSIDFELAYQFVQANRNGCMIQLLLKNTDFLLELITGQCTVLCWSKSIKRQDIYHILYDLKHDLSLQLDTHKSSISDYLHQTNQVSNHVLHQWADLVKSLNDALQEL